MNMEDDHTMLEWKLMNNILQGLQEVNNHIWPALHQERIIEYEGLLGGSWSIWDSIYLVNSGISDHMKNP